MSVPPLDLLLAMIVVAELVAIAFLAASLRGAKQALSSLDKHVNELAEARAKEMAETMVRQAREDAVKRSAAVVTGRVYEQLVPYLPWFRYNPREARFLGSPIDLVVFDGLEDGNIRSIVFLEVKKGSSRLSDRERMVKEAVERCAVRFEVIQIE